MKKILLIAMLLPIMAFAQENTTPEKKETPKKETTISVNANFSDPGQLGLSMERQSDTGKEGLNISYVFNVSVGSMEIDAFRKFTGTGIIIESGSRGYLSKEKWDGFYTENFISYGNIKFDEPTIANVQDGYEGTYSYFSMVNPNLGYKVNFGKFSFDPSVGFNWKWEIKGKGDVDNKDVDNLVFRVGAKLGYRF